LRALRPIRGDAKETRRGSRMAVVERRG
jgi:hypothetical protein